MTESDDPRTAAADRPATPGAVIDGESIKTLSAAARVFWSRPGVRGMAASALGGLALRACLGPPSVSDAKLVLGVVAWWPFQEWLAHRYLLHARPMELARLRLDPAFARAHRAHHKNPRDVDYTFLPTGVVEHAIPISALGWLIATRSVKGAATGVAAYSGMALVYEWTHFLVHTGYKPKTPWFRRVRRNHRFHHYRNERYWYAFTVPQVDALLGTEPDVRSVPVSNTVRNLHGLEG